MIKADEGFGTVRCCTTLAPLQQPLLRLSMMITKVRVDMVESK
jgi:hypothetical protein